jgi:hypothetical protein
VRHNLKLISSGQFGDVVRYDFGVTHFDVSYRVVLSGMGEEHYQTFVIRHLCFVVLGVAASYCECCKQGE